MAVHPPPLARKSEPRTPCVINRAIHEAEECWSSESVMSNSVWNDEDEINFLSGVHQNIMHGRKSEMRGRRVRRVPTADCASALCRSRRRRQECSHQFPSLRLVCLPSFHHLTSSSLSPSWIGSASRPAFCPLFSVFLPADALQQAFMPLQMVYITPTFGRPRHLL